MKIGLKLMATLAHLMPPGEKIANRVDIEIEEGVSLNDLVRKFNVPPELAHLVLINGVYVDPDDRDKGGLITENDVVAIWPPVAGG